MFFIIWIMQGKKDLHFSQRMVCPRCGKTENFYVVMTYETLTIFFIPTFKWGKRYFVKSDSCGTMYELDKEPGRLIEKGVQIELEESDLQMIKGFEQHYTPIKRCTECGYETEEDFEFCPKCGKKFE